MRSLIFTLLSILILVSGVFAIDDINSYEQIEIEIESELEFGVNKENGFSLESFFLTSYFYPLSIKGAQELEDFTTSFDDFYVDEYTGSASLVYTYDESTLQEDNSVTTRFVVKSDVHKPVVTEKVFFPLQSVDEEYSQYLEFRRFIDLSDPIQDKASELAQGEDDVFIIASKVAKWIREDIEYDLTTLTANPNQTSSQVFVSKQGVCREITNLYVSMMRSLGIPARVVTGYAYTNSDELIDLLGSPWGGHAWAEVLIGDTWVPFDLTYNQYGYVDASHIVLDRYVEIRTSSVSINGSGRGFTLRENSLASSREFTILDAVEQNYDPGFNISLKGPQEMGFGSYGYITVEATNEHDYYQVLFLQLAAPEQTELLDEPSQMIIFGPEESKEVHFRYKIPDDLEAGFYYTFPFTVYNELIQQDFNVIIREDKPRIKELALPEYEEEATTLSDNELEFACRGIIEETGDRAECTIKNPNNYEIDGIEVCAEDQCQDISLRINEGRILNFESTEDEMQFSYRFDEGAGSTTADLSLPQLDMSWEVNGSILRVDYVVEHYLEGVQSDIIVNGDTEQQLSEPQRFVLIDLPAGNNTIELSTRLGERQFTRKMFKVEVLPEDVPVRETPSSFSLFISWLLSFF